MKYFTVTSKDPGKLLVAIDDAENISSVASWALTNVTSAFFLTEVTAVEARALGFNSAVYASNGDKFKL